MNKKQIYQIWPSKNQFFFKKFMTGPKSDIPSNYIPIVCVIGLIIYYTFTILPIIWESLSILVVSSFTSFIINIILIMVTTFTDPGIIPRRPFLLYKQANLNFQNKTDYILLKKLEYFLYQSEDPQKILCPTCLIYRPKRASHCRDCDNCVLIHDHHCPFLHNCIGARNYKYFILCLISSICSTILFSFSFLQSIFVQSGSHNQSYTIQVFGIIIAGILGLIVVLFFIFHFYLICKGVTTRQMIKSRKKNIRQITKQNDNRIQMLLHSETMQISQKLNKLTFFKIQQNLIDFFKSIPENVSQKIQLQLEKNKLISKRIFQTGQQPIYLKHIKQETFSEFLVANNSILLQQQFDESNLK